MKRAESTALPPAAKRAWGKRRGRSGPGRPRASKKGAAIWPQLSRSPASIDPLDVIRRALAEKDSFMLGRQVSYRLSTSESIPALWGQEGSAAEALGDLLVHLSSRAVRRSAISISLREFVLRSGRAVEFAFESLDRLLRDGQEREFLSGLFDGSRDGASGISLVELRERVMSQHGRFWADSPVGNRVTYHVVFPSSEEAVNRQAAGHRLFKYEIFLTNYGAIRKGFGIKKSSGLIEQIERYVKSLVWYPMDIVTSDAENGSIAVVYEAQHGAAESLSSRLSKRLGRETFHIGKKPVELDFRYSLTMISDHVIASATGGG